MIVVLTGLEQSGNAMNEDVKQEINQGLQEGHGLDKGVAFCLRLSWKCTCIFFDFETCEEINLKSRKGVRCIACR